MKMSQRGQGLLEALLALPVLILIVTVVTMLLYRIIVFHFSNYQAHEAMVCAQSEGTYYCEKELEKKIRSILISGATLKVDLQGSVSGGFKTIIDIDVNPSLKEFRLPLKIEKSIPRIGYENK